MKNQELTTHTAPASVSVFGAASSFEGWMQLAKTLASSTLVPKSYQKNEGDCLIALDMASRMNVSPIMLMQNMEIIHGKPALSSKYKIAMIDSSGSYEPLRYEFITATDISKVKFTQYSGQYPNRTATEKTMDAKNHRCRCYTVDKKTKERLNGPWVSISMAIKEGWFTKKGSKWQTMPDLMLHYRAASFWANIYAPGASMGMPTKEEVIDVGHTVEGEFEDLTNASPIIDMNRGIEENFTEDQPDEVVAEVVTQSPPSESIDDNDPVV